MSEENPYLILIAEDDNDFRDIIVTKLQSLGFKVAEAVNGEEAVKKAKELKPNLLILDVHMPKMDGVEAFFQIKNEPELQKTKCVFLTSYGDPNHETGIDNKVAQEIGAVDYIKKTDDLDVIMNHIKEIVGCDI